MGTNEEKLLAESQKTIDELKKYYCISEANDLSEWMILKKVSEELIPKMYKNKVTCPLFFISTVIFFFKSNKLFKEI